jgi:hypothetical protein
MWEEQSKLSSHVFNVSHSKFESLVRARATFTKDALRHLIISALIINVTVSYVYIYISNVLQEAPRLLVWSRDNNV